MDEFPGLLSREFGLRPQGRSAPMAAAKSSTPPRSTPASAGFDDLDGIFATKPAPAPAPDYDAMFDGFSSAKPPAYDRPVYDEDLFDGVPGMKPSKGGGGGVEDVFASLSVGSGRGGGGGGGSDFLGDLKDGGSGGSGRKVEASEGGFEDLIPGFGGGSASGPSKRDYSDTDLRHSSSNPNISPNTMSNDPFADLESTSSVPSYPSSGLFVDPLDEINVPPRKSKSSVSSGLFDDLNAFSGVNRSASPIPSNTGEVQKDKSLSYAAEGKSYGHPAAAEEFTERFSSRNSADTASKKRSGGIRNEPEVKGFDIPIDNLESMTSERRFGSQTADSSFNQFEMNSKEHSHVDDDIWLTVSEIPLFTQPTRAPPPSRRPPPFNNRKGASAKRQTNASFPFPQHTKEYMPSESFSDSPKTFGVSSIDELEDFAMGKSKAYTDEQTEVVSSEEDNDSSIAAANSAAAMKDAMDRAEAKMRQARELREREKETRVNKSRESKNNAASDFYHEEHKETSDSFDPEQEQLEREEKEREQRRLERERQRELQRERERAAVDKVLREARARATADARQKAERAAVEKANAEARERAARAAVQRVTAEKREKEAAEARERAAAEARAAVEARERAAAEAKERANIETREREAKEREARERAAAANREREKAAVQRAAAEARRRHERAAVERANEESRQRAAAAAREKQRKNENDLDSFFGAGNRATSEPKQRAASAEFSFDAQVPKKGSSAGVPPASSNSSSSGIRKTASTNILDDLTSVFGAPSASGEFPDIEGETEERRRARLERHQRTLERAAKALAEKNERDMQVQKEQVEKDRIAGSLDVEIRRWAAGKEGNLRALLSTLQYILWPGCGWQPVSLTDLITGASVKKVYRKATLHIHPDKVQQKGANLEQKIIAEKVFDLLKEAWNKFNSEELF